MLTEWVNKNHLAGSIAVCCFGAIIMALAITIFLAPMQIPVGGFTGIATILSTSGIINISIGTLTLLLNVPLFLFSYRSLGSRFGILSLISTVVYTMAITLTERSTALNALARQMTDKALATVYGASVYGLGLGLIIRMGGSTGGNDMVANLLAEKVGKANIGNVIFGIDFLVILLAAIVYKSFLAPLYAFLTSFLSAKVVDYIIEGGKSSKAYFIFSQKHQEIGQAIIEKLQRGVTSFRGLGMYTNAERQMLLCLVFRSQAVMMKNIVKNIDDKAFMFATNVSEAFGYGFTPFEPDKKIYRKKKIIKKNIDEPKLEVKVPEELKKVYREKENPQE
ncbi:MAG: YitT family protein [Christensenellales bacterium]|jgi:uncharacterized membrane-anchored protein YitT (DUF2179 family)